MSFSREVKRCVRHNFVTVVEYINFYRSAAAYLNSTYVIAIPPSSNSNFGVAAGTGEVSGIKSHQHPSVPTNLSGLLKPVHISARADL